MNTNIKKLLAVTISVVTMGFSAYADRNVKIETKDLPQRAQEFLTAFFNQIPVDSVTTDQERTEYEVAMTMGLDVEFDKNGNWTKVERDMQKMQISMMRMREGMQRNMPGQNQRSNDKNDKKDRKNRDNKENNNKNEGQRPQGQWGQGGQRPQGQWGQSGQRPQGQWGQGGQRPQGQWGQGGQRPQGQWGQGGQRPGMFMMESLLNDNIKNHIRSNYQFAMITVIERYSNGYLVKVATGRDTSDSLVFSLDGKFIQKMK